MAERRDDEPVGGARRTGRRTPGVLEIGPLSARRPGAAGTGRGGISEARAYTPRGRTVRETGLDRPTDPDRPALRLVDGGPADPSADRRSRTPGPRRAARSDGAQVNGRNDRYHRDSGFDDDHADFDDRADLDERDDDLDDEPAFLSAARRRASASTAIPTRDVSRGAPHGPKRADAARSRAGDGTSGPTPRRQPSRLPSRGGTPPRASRDGRPRRVRPPLRTFRPTKRLRIGTVIALLIFTVLGGRLVLLQLTDGRAYAAAGLKDRLTTTVLEARRGSIVDRNGNVLAAEPRRPVCLRRPDPGGQPGRHRGEAARPPRRTGLRAAAEAVVEDAGRRVAGRVRISRARARPDDRPIRTGARPAGHRHCLRPAARRTRARSGGEPDRIHRQRLGRSGRAGGGLQQAVAGR